VEIGHLDEITTRMPTPDEDRTLDLGAGVPVLIYMRTAHTKDRPVRLTKTIFAGDRNRLVYELDQLNALDKGAPTVIVPAVADDLDTLIAFRDEAAHWLPAETSING
jgi:UTRA domain